MANILGESPTMKAMDVGTSAPQNTAVGGGSRPTKSKMDTEVSAPKEPRTLGRATPGWLK